MTETDTVNDADAPKENLKPLKMLVFSMGLIMVGGVLLLAALVWKKVDAEASGAVPGYACAGGEADLQGKGLLVDYEREGKLLHLVFEPGADSVEFVTLESCSGKVKSALKLRLDSQVCDNSEGC